MLPFLVFALLQAIMQLMLFSAYVQSAACARISVKPSIFEAAKSGDCSLLRDHLALDPSCIHTREDGRCYQISLGKTH